MARRTRIISAGAVALLNDPDVIAHMQALMTPVLAQAVASASVDSGAYRASLHMETVTSGDRAAVRVVADVPYAMAVEAATGNLARALDAVGG